MIEQTAMEVVKWDYQESPISNDDMPLITSAVTLDVQKKRNAQKKGIALRFTCQFMLEKEMILEFSGEHSYVIDFEEMIDKNELTKMIRNSYQMFKEKFDFKKLNTSLKNHSLQPLNESDINLDGIIPMLM